MVLVVVVLLLTGDQIPNDRQTTFAVLIHDEPRSVSSGNTGQKGSPIMRRAPMRELVPSRAGSGVAGDHRHVLPQLRPELRARLGVTLGTSTLHRSVVRLLAPSPPPHDREHAQTQHHEGQHVLERLHGHAAARVCSITMPDL